MRAPRLPPAAGDAAFSVVRIDPERLNEARRVDEALREAPGVSLFRRTSSLSANPTTQGLSLRAIAPSGAGRALVTLDGVPLNDPFGGWVIWSQLPPEALAGATIVRGAGAGPYGAGALTGVVELQERDAGWAASLAGGELGSERASGAASLPVGTARVTASAAAETFDGYVPVRGSARGAADTPTHLDAASAAARLDVPIGEALLALRLGAYEERRNAGLVSADSEASGAVASATLARAPARVGYGWRLQAWARSSDFANSSVAVAPGRTNTTPAAEQFETPAVGYGVNAALRRRITGGEWEVGADARLFDGETRERFRFMQGAFTRGRVAGGQATVAGVYAEASRTSGPWLVTGGARVDRWSSLDGSRREVDLATGAPTLDVQPEDQEGTVASLRAGARLRLSGGLFARAAAYQGFRPATLNELHRPFRVGNDLTEANAALAPERLSGAEVGLSGDTAPLRWSVAAFWNRVEDPIANVTIGEGPGTFPVAGFVPAGGVLRQRRNAGRIDALGLEADIAGDLSERLQWRAAAALTDARVDGGSAAPQLTGRRPAQAPAATVTAGLDWRASERLTLSAAARYESRRFEDDLNSRSLAPALTLDAEAQWRWRDGVWLVMSAENLSDEEVETSETADGVEGYAQPRIVRLGLRLRG